ncbi:hypothetical protein [Bartonella rattimassiliensis]|nr:hypothetical protein [Bartonella rattimassiliensis]
MKEGNKSVGALTKGGGMQERMYMWDRLVRMMWTRDGGAKACVKSGVRG